MMKPPLTRIETARHLVDGAFRGRFSDRTLLEALDPMSWPKGELKVGAEGRIYATDGWLDVAVKELTPEGRPVLEPPAYWELLVEFTNPLTPPAKKRAA